MLEHTGEEAVKAPELWTPLPGWLCRAGPEGQVDLFPRAMGTQYHQLGG